jgi:hypothetical protein
MDSMFLKGTDGMFEVTKEDTEISSFVASHYLASNKVTITFTESDRDSLMALPDREMSFLATALSCESSEVIKKLLPAKPIFKSKKKTKAKAKVVETKPEVLEDE